MIDINKNHLTLPLKIVFAGTNDFALKHLIKLITTNFKIVGIITQPDRPSGRGHTILHTPIKNLAKIYKIPVFQPISLKESIIYTQLMKLNADIMVVVSYGKLIPKNILHLFPLGGINVHASLLPKWRGPSPIQSAILNGDKKTGITVIQINENIDEGNILYSMMCPILFNETGKSLQKKLIKLGCTALIQTLKRISTKKNFSIIQSKLTTYSKKIKKEDAQLLWNFDALTLERSIRAFNPWPVCFFTINQIKIKVWSATITINKCYQHKIGEIIILNKNGMQIQTKTNILNIKNIQLPGKKIMHAYNLYNTSHKWYKKKFLY